MIYLFSDFGAADIYVGQMKAEILARAPQAALVDLLHDARSFDVTPAAHLLAALVARLPAAAVVVAVVDPAVGTRRRALAVHADGRWLLGPDNGLLSVVVARSRAVACCEIRWTPPQLSASFHGRDLFAPFAALLHQQQVPLGALAELSAIEPLGEPADDLAQCIYVDHYGNAYTGLRASRLPAAARLQAGDRSVPRARVFADVPVGTPFWYENSLGLAEIAVNQGSAAALLGLHVGSPIAVLG